MTDNPLTGRHARALALLLGLGLFTGLVAWRGLETVTHTMAAAGWGVLWLVPLFLLPLWLASEAWRVLFPRGSRPSPLLSLHLTWIGLGVNWLLPVAQVGGEVVKVRLLALRERDAKLATATVVVDKTVQTATVVLFALLGLGLLGLRHAGGELAAGILVGSLLFGVGVFLFWRLQLAGVFGRAAGLLERFLPLETLDLATDAEEVDDRIREIYADARRSWGSVLWRMAFRVALAAEVWVVLALLGEPVGLLEILVLESLGQAARAAGFAIPAGLGAQEGGFALGAAAVGLSPEVGLVLSLAKRVRELAAGVPALLAWQAEEGRSALRSA